MGNTKHTTEPFSERCPIEGYKCFDPDFNRYYFWNSEYGLMAIIEDDRQHSVLFKVKKKLPENLDDFLDMIHNPGGAVLGDFSSELFETMEELEDFLNKFMNLLTNQQQ